jgi:hypothetical protein
MVFDPNTLLTVEELMTPRTPAELVRWVEDKFRLFKLFKACPEAREWVLLRQGLSKQFHEEVYPLKFLVTRLYAGRSHIQCIPNLDNRDFDAIIRDNSTSPPAELKVEITSAVNGYDNHLRMKHLVKHRRVSAIGKVSASGTKHRGHEIHVAHEFVERSVLWERTCALIRSAVARKSMQPNAPQRYGPGHVLLVAFAEWGLVESAQDIVAIKDFVEKYILILPLNFAALYVVGLAGRTFLHFLLPKIQDGPEGANHLLR